ncbi:MAG: N-acetyltransferase [Maricaulaceae bacterium]|nr:N-acetyltransferase [Maricaulaceae bacterium]
MQIRAARAGDHDAADALLKAAFPGPEEARLVRALRAADAGVMEWVCEGNGKVSGMVVFSPVKLDPDAGDAAFGFGLGPVAVIPALQRQGIGAALIRAGLDQVRRLGAAFVVVLGAPSYYERFGFSPASAAGWRWSGDPDGAAGDAFQRLVIDPARTPSGPAVIHYHPAFDGV